MTGSAEQPSPRAPTDFLAGGWEMGERMRAFDWSRTPVGPVAAWPQSLRTAIRIVLSSRYPMFVWWGRELTHFYNDAYIPVLGKRHPQALGRPGSEVWADIWATVGPEADVVMNEGRATWNEELLLVMERYGFVEETYFTYSYSPLPDDAGGVGGVFCACIEDTGRVLGERRLKTLRDLGLAEARTVAQACHSAAATLAGNPHDFPFALIYLLDDDGRQARLAEAVQLGAGAPASPLVVALGTAGDVWDLRRVAETGQELALEGLEERFGRLPAGPWADDWTRRALVLPIARAGAQERPAGFLVAGISPRLAFTDDYRGFLGLTAGQLATALANVRAYEEERRRAEALAELDRAKTAFFSNVSHEFRTPLTLLLGPLEDTLADPLLPAPDRERLEVVQRNSMRLLKLVNTLLEFSRLEAGRTQAVFEPTDLPAFTAELASGFRSAVERAGLRFVVDCPPLAEPVWVDREMWEKVVLNLLSNAFKFTFEGEIEVSVRPEGPGVELRVRDTGTGIPADELAHLFKRFHRVKEARGRTFEGSGIGLALVEELVKLHGGTVRVESELGRGTTFTVRLPAGRDHLPPDRVGVARAAPFSGGRQAYAEEALRWLPEEARDEPVVAARPRVLLADDNADMRDYVRRLLSPRYEVVAVADGEAALAAAREQAFDLVLSDVMMPRLNGFALLAALRGEERTRTLPFILLSARAGEESKVEGLEAGADDFLVKPFSARELLARVEGNLKLSRLRREVEAALRASEDESRRYRMLIEQSADFIGMATPDGRALFINEGARRMVGTPEGFDWSGVRISDFFFPEDLPLLAGEILPMLLGGQSWAGEMRFRHFVTGEAVPVWYDAFPIKDAQGRVTGLATVTRDISLQKRRELDALFLRDLDAALAPLADADEIEQVAIDHLGTYLKIDRCYFGQILGLCAAVRHEFRCGGASLVGDYRLDDFFSQEVQRQLVEGAATVVADVRADPRTAAAAANYEALGIGAFITTPVKYHDRWVGALNCVSRSPRAWRAEELQLTQDLAARVWPLIEQARAVQALRAADRRKDEFLAMLAHELRNPLAPIRNAAHVLKLLNPPDPKQQWAREVIERQSQHLSRLVDDLLDVSRITQGKVILTYEPVDLAAVLHRAVEMSRPLIEARGHHLALDLPAEPLRVQGDSTRLVQVVDNLLNNAAKYTDEGGHLHLSAALEGSDAVVRVRDDGMGVAADLLPHVFDLFTQADRSLDRSQGGLGIGLTLVRQLIELHGGRVEAKSKGPGRGSEFILRLPALPPAGDAGSERPDGEGAGTGKTARHLKILVVEDNADSAEMMSFVLELSGHEVRVAHDGPAALEAVWSFRPQAVICDIGLPGMSGYEVAARLRAQEGLDATVFIALTGYGQVEDRRRSREAGFDHHLVKPVEPEALKALLDSLSVSRS